jgi:putative DNA methylase
MSIRSWLKEHVSRRLVVERRLASETEGIQSVPTTDARVVQGSSERILMPDNSVDLILTDPPYHDDVQYDELSLPLRAWAHLPTSRLENEAVARHSAGQDTESYQELLARIFREARRVLVADGHLILSYANREPQAWVAVLCALQKAGLRAVGYTIVHSENETDYAKRGVGACALDMIMDLVPAGEITVNPWQPPRRSSNSEEEFLRAVGDVFLQVGSLPRGWEPRLIKALRTSHFLSRSSLALA